MLWLVTKCSGIVKKVFCNIGRCKLMFDLHCFSYQVADVLSVQLHDNSEDKSIQNRIFYENKTKTHKGLSCRSIYLILVNCIRKVEQNCNIKTFFSLNFGFI